MKTMLLVSIKTIVYALSCLCHRSSKIWVYGSFAKGFIDNSKYLFIGANATQCDVRHVWISHSKETVQLVREQGFESYHSWSLQGVFFMLRAKVYIYSAYPTDIAPYAMYCGGALKINLWHGIPLKKIEYDITQGPLRKLYNPQSLIEKFQLCFLQPSRFRDSDMVLVVNNWLVPLFKRAFRVTDDDVIISEYPRAIPFSMGRTELLAHIDKYGDDTVKSLLLEIKKYDKCLIYMPTWRDDDPDFFDKALPDVHRINEFCLKNNTLLLLKLHPVTKIKIKSFPSNIVLVNNKIDVYTLLPFTDVLITDYSSIFFDYCILNKNIVFYPYDFDEYVSKRELYFDYMTITNKNVVFTFDELLIKLSSIIENNEDNNCLDLSCFLPDSDNSDLGKIFNKIRSRTGLPVIN